MEEIVFWREVDVKDELPQENAICFRGEKKLLFQWKGEDLKQLNVTHWLKRVVVNILSDQEIELERAFLAGMDFAKNPDKYECFGDWKLSLTKKP